jgi:hypothetical protein
VTYPLGVLTLIAITVVWGTTFVIVKGSLETIPVSLLLALRFSLAAAAFAFVRFDRRASMPALWLGLLAFAGFATQTMGLSITSASRSAFITGLSVVLTPLVAASGSASASRRASTSRASSPSPAWRCSRCVVATARGSTRRPLDAGHRPRLRAVHRVPRSGRRARQRSGPGRHAAPADGDLGLAVGGPELGALAHVPLQTYLAIAYLALVATALVAVLQVAAQRVVPASVAAIVFVLEPVFAATFAWWLAGETLGPRAGRVGCWWCWRCSSRSCAFELAAGEHVTGPDADPAAANVL